MTPKLLLEGIDYILSNPLSTGDALLAHLQKPKGIGPLNASMLWKVELTAAAPRRPLCHMIASDCVLLAI